MRESHNDGKDNFETTTLWWDCECKENYIHRNKDSVCFKCSTIGVEQPDSRVNEVLALFPDAEV